MQLLLSNGTRILCLFYQKHRQTYYFLYGRNLNDAAADKGEKKRTLLIDTLAVANTNNFNVIHVYLIIFFEDFFCENICM